MKVAPILRELMAAGLEGERLIAAIERIEAGQPEIEEELLSPGARRTRRWRERHKASQSVTSVTCDALVTPSEQKKSSPTPPKKKTTPSVSNETSGAAAAAPIFEDSTHELWHEGVAILGQLGVSDKPARSNIGRWLRDAKSDAAKVLGAIQRARDARTRDPIPFVTGALRTGGQRPRNLGFLDLALEINTDEQPHHDPPRLIGSD